MKKNFKCIYYRIQFADGQFFNFACYDDNVARLQARKYITEFDFAYTLINGTHVNLFRVFYDPFKLHLVGKVFPFKRKYIKAVNLWTGLSTKVPVTSSHLVCSCLHCKYLGDLDAPICKYCNGCLDCRDYYKRPFSSVISFSEFLDRIVHYNELPF